MCSNTVPHTLPIFFDILSLWNSKTKQFSLRVQVVESADYDTTKAGVISLTKNFSQALAPHIRVTCVAPGWVETEINKDVPKDVVDGGYK